MSDEGSAVEPNALPNGTILGDFEVRRMLGVGGFSIVYVAFDHSLQREVALKEYMPASLARRGTPIERIEAKSATFAAAYQAGLRSFVNEARLLAQFDHPSLVKVYRFWEANGTAYMVMPVYRGPTLRELRRTMSGPPDEAWIRRLLYPLLGAVDTLHQAQVFHRDIAPDNILLVDGERPVLLDFGAARRVIGDLTTQELTAILKPSYAPIEQYSETESLKQGAWTDLYGLGATLHFLLLGKPPPPATSRVVGDAGPPLAQQSIPGISAALLHAIDWMLAIRPTERPQSVDELKAVLDRQDGAPTLASPARMPAPPHEPAPVAARPSFPSDGPPARTGPLAWLRAWWSRPAPAPAAAESPATPPEIDATPARDRRNDRTMILPKQGPHAVSASPDRTVILGPATTSTESPAPGVALTVVRCDTASFVGRRVALRSTDVRLGREQGELVVPDPLWSREHAVVQHEPGGYSIVDLDSSNGTFVNGFRLAPRRPYPLHPGAQVRVGTTLLALTVDADDALSGLAGIEIADRYKLVACLQASPKGALYRAEKKPSGVRVAVKLLAPSYASFADHRKRFETEARIAASLQHPHVCRLDDYGEARVTLAGRAVMVPFLSYPIMAGGSLSDRMGALATVDNVTIATWLLQIGQALQHAHEHGVVHGNLKPSAICFDEAANAYVTDFAVTATAAADQPLMGAPAYMAPERWEGAPASARGDQFALAVLAYSVLAGVRPFEGQEDPEMRARNLRQGPADLVKEAASCSGRKVNALSASVVARGLARDPQDRFDTVLQFATALSAALRAGDRARASAQVFISYRRETSAGWVTFIADQLRRDHEISSFVDTQRLDGAAQFPDRVRQAIEGCGVFVCLLAPSTLESPYVRQEIELAHAFGKPMIPVFQEGFRAGTSDTSERAIQDLLLFDGIQLLDRQNVYVHSAVSELAKQIRITLDLPGS